MADINVPATPPTPTPPPAPPVIAEAPTPERSSIPVSAIFDEGELNETPTTDTPAVTPPTVPAATPPAAPAATPPVEPPPVVPPAPEPPKPEAKIKIGDKEYTPAELEAEFKKRTEAPATPPPAPAAPVVPPAPAPTKEEIVAKESKWVADFVSKEKQNLAFSTEEMETFLAGGEDATKLFDTKLNEAVARAVLLARKSMYAELNPVLQSVNERLSPVLQQAQEVEYAAAEQEFLTQYPDFTKDMDVVRQIGQALIQNYPDQFLKMSREQQIREVAAQSDRYLQEQYKRFNPASTANWRESRKAATTPPVASAAPAAPTAPAVPATPPPVQPPSSNSPAATAAGGAPADFHKRTAKDLQD